MVRKTIGTEAMKSTKYISKLTGQTISEKIYKEMNARRGREGLKIVQSRFWNVFMELGIWEGEVDRLHLKKLYQQFNLEWK